MCFSVEADVAVGLLILPVAVASLREVRHVREVPFAALPLLFALHQLVEALVWAGEDGQVSPGVQHAAAAAYLLFALPVLPTLMPVAVPAPRTREPAGAWRRSWSSAWRSRRTSAGRCSPNPFTVIVHPHAIEYEHRHPPGQLVGGALHRGRDRATR